MDNLDFSEEEIQEQLAILGYKNIPKHRLLEFKQDLDELVRHGEWKSLASSTQINSDKSQVATSQSSPPAYTKEKVSRQCYFRGSGEGFFLHTGQLGNDRQALTTCQNRHYRRQQEAFDSYAQHSVALKLRLPPGAPSRLQVEPDPDPDDTLDPPLTDSCTSTPDSHRGRFIRRKVLRKHKGQSLVCDESIYSEDSALCLHRSHTSAGVQVANMYKMYGSQWDRESEGDDSSLNSSFWSDGERQEDEEEVKIEQVVGKEDSKPVADAEDSYQKASEEEEGGRERVITEEGAKPVGGPEGSYQEASEEEKIERSVVKEEPKPVGDSEESHHEASEQEELSEEESEAVTDGEDSYTEASEEEEEENERVISGEDSKSVGESEGSCQEDSEEEVDNSEEDSKPVGDTENSYTEASEDEEEETERVIDEEDSKTVGESEDSHQEASEEEEEENDEEDSKSTDDAEDFSQEASEEEEEENNEEESKPVGDAEASEDEETEGAIGEEDSKHVRDSEDSSQEALEEEEEMGEEDSPLVGDAEDFYQEASEEDKPELHDQVNISRETLEGESKDDDDDEDEESCSSSSDSPAPSLMTSGYGTYRPEEVEGGDYRDDHTITEFDQDSRGDLSEMREDEEEDSRSLCSFTGFDMEATEPDYKEARPLSVLAGAEHEANVLRRRNDDLHIRVDVTEVKAEEDATSQEQHHTAVAEDTLEGGSDGAEGGKLYERLEEKVLDLKEEKEEKEVENKVESEDPDESSSNDDIKFIDSKVDFSQMSFDKMCEEWEGNLRQKKDAASCLEERLADLHLSSPAQRDFETEDEDITSQSDTQSSETEGVSFSAFESYMRGMTRAQSDGDLRPKPKSFIRPVMSQQTIKKTDPVAKYFQYKQLWEMFKLPGEKDRRALRLEIKERLAYQPPPPKPRRVYVPNTYIVPTEKKRSALRWEIRNDLANGLLPHKFSYRF